MDLDEKIKKHRNNFKSMYIDGDFENNTISWREWLENNLIDLNGNTREVTKYKDTYIVGSFWFSLKTKYLYKNENSLMPDEEEREYLLNYDSGRNIAIPKFVYDYIKELYEKQ